MDPHITFIGLGVEDLQRSIDFYQKGLGFPRKEGPDGIAFFQLAGIMLSLYPRDKMAEDITVNPQGSGFPGFTLAHNVSSEEAVDAILNEAVTAGAVLVKPGQKVFWGGY
ncbi:MAG TPA: VOC family protein, partial [Rhodospirillales bacterium]|nr:VOC family protein [Rhodospirillales bacterium]